jgi:hypothetical protein
VAESLVRLCEGDFIDGKLDPNPGYRRVLVHRIRKKREAKILELKQIDEFLKKTES